MGAVKTLLATAALIGAAALFAAGCSSGAKKTAATAPAKPAAPRCAHPAGWQKLANRIGAPVYCPGWLPDPLVGQIGGRRLLRLRERAASSAAVARADRI